jgi:two-component system, OmpR family, response regulator
VNGELGRVMLVEDDRDIRTVTEASLALVGGFTVCACESGEQALAAAEAFRPQLILLDVMMPGMDGPAVLAALRARADTAEVPVVFLTAKARTEEVRKLERLDALGIIAKPFDPMSLPRQVLELWEKAPARGGRPQATTRT